MKKALVRADGSVEIGMGHIVRCIGLAQELEKAGFESFFVVKSFEPSITELIKSYGFKVELIPKDYSLQQDKNALISFIKQHRAELVVTDLSTDDILNRRDEYLAYLCDIKKHDSLLLTIDDLNVMNFPSDIVLNPNYGARELPHRLNKHTRYLLGPDYFIFRQEFIEAARAGRTIKTEAINILVSMGGGDLQSLTYKVLKALSALSETEELTYRILPGVDASPYRQCILTEALRNFKGSYEFHSSKNSVAASMLWADLAITGGGLTKYETAVTGTPSIIIPQIKHQEELAKLFAQEGSALFLGPSDGVAEETITPAVERLLRDESLRAEMSSRGKKLVDGKGVERVTVEIKKSLEKNKSL